MSLANGVDFSHKIPALCVCMVAGGGAGSHTVAGIGVNDRIVSVRHLTLAHDAVFGFDITTNLDYTTEYKIIAAGAIDNTGGTTSANKTLWVAWIKAHPNA